MGGGEGPNPSEPLVTGEGRISGSRTTHRDRRGDRFPEFFPRVTERRPERPRGRNVPQVDVGNDGGLDEIFGSTEVLPARTDRLRAALEDNVQLGTNQVRVREGHRVLDRASREDLVEERLRGRRRGADDGEQLSALNRVGFRELREERVVADQEGDPPDLR